MTPIIPAKPYAAWLLDTRGDRVLWAREGAPALFGVPFGPPSKVLPAEALKGRPVQIPGLGRLTSARVDEDRVLLELVPKQHPNAAHLNADLCDTLPTGVMLFSEGGEIIAVNRSFIQLVGARGAPSEWTGRATQRLVGALSSALQWDWTESDQDTAIQHRGLALRVRSFEAPHTKQRVLLLDEILAEPPGNASHPEDARIHEAQRLESLALLAGGIAHDFNNLLLVIRGNAELVAEALKPSNPLFEYLSDIQAAADRATDLTREMLAYSGHGPMNREAVDLGYTLSYAITEQRRTTSPRIKFIDAIAADIPSVDGDPKQLHHAVQQILTNAVEAIGEAPGHIRLTAEEHKLSPAELRTLGLDPEQAAGRFVQVIIEDDGPGIPQGSLERVFDPFFTDKESGRGLGLSATLGIIRSHGGGIRVESAPGEGTRVRVYLPASETSIPQVTASLTREGATTILVVDDEPLVRRVACRALRNAGFEVVEAENGEHALRVFRSHRDDIGAVLMDVVMPLMDGRTAARRISASSNVPILLSSGFTPDAVPESVYFLQKPYDGRALVSAVRDAMADSSAPFE